MEISDCLTTFYKHFLRVDLQALIIPADANRVLKRRAEQGLGRDLRTWCPECFQAWRSVGHPLYEPLLWSIAAVAVCPHHYKPLQSHCPHCQKAQRPLTSRTQVAQCSQCFGWLGIRTTPSETELLIATQLEQHLEIAETMMQVMNLG